MEGDAARAHCDLDTRLHTALTGRELDAAVAEALGLPVRWSSCPYLPKTHEGRQPYLKGIVGGVEYDWAPVPYYTLPPGSAALRDELHKRGWMIDCRSELGHARVTLYAPEGRADVAAEAATEEEALVRAVLLALGGV